MTTTPPRPTKSRRRKIVSTLCWTLALLLLTNVFWSVWFAYAQDISGEPLILLDGELSGRARKAEHPWYVDLAFYRETAATDRVFLFRSDADYLLEEEINTHSLPNGGFSPEFDAFVPRWIHSRHDRMAKSANSGEFIGELTVMIGWPVRILWCSWRWQTETDSLVVSPDSGLAVFPPDSPTPGSIMIRPGASRALPFRPILTGQLFYATFWLTIVLAVPFTRKRFRTWRNRCTNCSYDLQQNTTGVCPECGSEVKS